MFVASKNSADIPTDTLKIILYQAKYLVYIALFFFNNKFSRTRNGELCTRFWWGNPREGDHWGDQDVDGRIILRWIFRKWVGVVGTG